MTSNTMHTFRWAETYADYCARAERAGMEPAPWRNFMTVMTAGKSREETGEFFSRDHTVRSEPHLSERINEGVSGQRGNRLALAKQPASVTGRRFSFFEKLNIGPATNVYLRRWYIVSTPWFGLYLHHILRPDADLDMHNHPWAFTTIVLKGGYVEQRRTHDPLATFPVHIRQQENRPGRIRRFGLNEYHRIASLLDPERGSWTICLIGRRRRVWSFLTPEGEVPWNEYNSVA